MIWTLLFGLVVVGKCLATGLMIGAESAGGLFGPVLFIGGTVGAAVGAFIEAFLPGTFPDSLRQALIPVGMAGVLSASLRTPLAAIVMVTEMTGSYGLIVPLMLVSVLAYMLGNRWGVYPEQVASPSESPAHAGESLVTMLENWTVKDLLPDSWPNLVTPATTLPQLVALLKGGTRPIFAVVDKHRLAGMISTADISRVVNLGISTRSSSPLTSCRKRRWLSIRRTTCTARWKFSGASTLMRCPWWTAATVNLWGCSPGLKLSKCAP